MTKFLGPAIIFHNDREMRNINWKSLKKVFHSEKRNDLGQVGKFGMGSRSYFHLSDLQIWISRGQYNHLDPLGLVDDSIHRGRSHLFSRDNPLPPAEIEAFSLPDFDVDLDTGEKVPGTTIRLPLRNESMLVKGKEPLAGNYTVESANVMLERFLTELQDGKMLLFLRNIEKIEVYDRKSNGLHKRAVLAVRVTSGDYNDSWSRYEELKTSIKHADDLQKLKSLESLEEVPLFRRTVRTELTVFSGGRHIGIRVASWDLASQLCLDQELLNLRLDLPEISCAIPTNAKVAETTAGRVFCALPMPIETGFPVHLNAPFAVSQNRRDLKTMGEDLSRSGEAAKHAQWNEILLKKAFPELLRREYKARPGRYELWPKCPNPVIACLEKPLINLLQCEPVIALRHRRDPCTPRRAIMVDFSEVKQLSSEIIGFCDKIGMVHVVDLPQDVQDWFKKHGVNSPTTVSDIFERMLSKRNQYFNKWSVNDSLVTSFGSIFLQYCRSNSRDFMRRKFKSLVNFKWAPVITDCSTKFMSPEDMFDPREDDISHFVVVGMRYPSVADEDLDYLLSFGMKTSLNWDDVASEVVYVRDLGAAQELLKYMGQVNHFRWSSPSHDVVKILKESEWIPCKRPSDNFKRSALALAKLGDLFPKSKFEYVWATGSSAACDLPVCIQDLQATRSIEQKVLYQQLQKLAKFSKIENKFKHMKNVLNLMQFNEERFSKYLTDEAWVPCDSGQEESEPVFLPLAKVAKTVPPDLMPHFASLWPAMRHVKMFCMVPDRLPLQALSSAMNLKYGIKFCCHVAAEMARGVQNASNDFAAQFLPSVILPTSNGKLKKASELCVVDYAASSSGVDIVHTDISQTDARILGCQSLRQHLADVCEAEDVGEPFGQEEDFPLRIKQLCKELDVSDIFIEFFQNSDDFGASRMKFLFDEGTYCSEKLVSVKAKDLQGPALYIASDKPLSPEDIERMRQVSDSKKKGDYTTAGRFGIGMNSMYIVSDCPQLLADGKLYFFDLQRKFVTKHTHKGERGKAFKIDSLKQSFPSSFAPFRKWDLANWPVIFRLPLRQRHSEIGLECSVDFDGWQQICNAQKVLLFSRSIRAVTVTGQDEDGHTLDESMYSIHGRQVFELPKTKEEVLALHENDKTEYHVSKFDMKTREPDGQEVTEKWITAHALRFTEDGKVLHDTFLEDGLALLPHGAVAYRVRSAHSVVPHTHSLHCHFPVQELERSLPYAIHASFCLTSNRKNIDPPTEKGTPEQRWNAFLLKEVVSQAIFELIDFERGYLKQNPMAIDRYMKLFPTQAHDSDAIGFFIQCGVQERINVEERIVLPVVRTVKQKIANGSKNCWTVSKKFERWPQDNSDIILPPQTGYMNDELCSCLIQDGLDIVSVPKKYTISVGARHLDDSIVLQLIKHSRVLTNPLSRFLQKINEGLTSSKGMELAKMPFYCLRQKQHVLSILQFCLTHMCDRARQTLANSKAEETTNRGKKNVDGAATSDSISVKLDITALMESPLLLLHGDDKDRVELFGTEVFYTGHHLVPKNIDKSFVHLDCLKHLQSCVPNNADGLKGPSLESVGLSGLDLVQLSVMREAVEASFCKHYGDRDDMDQEIVEEQAEMRDRLRYFWDFVVQDCEVDPNSDSFSQLAEWKALPVFLADGGDMLATISTAKETIFLDSFGSSKDLLYEIAYQCRIPILQDVSSASASVRKFFSDITIGKCSDFITLLHSLTSGPSSMSFSHECSTNILKFLDSQRRTLRSQDIINQVRGLPIFPKQGELGELEDCVAIRSDVVCLSEPNASLLEAVEDIFGERLEVLQVPSSDFCGLYEVLEIKKMTMQEFVLEYMVPKIQHSSALSAVRDFVLQLGHDPIAQRFIFDKMKQQTFVKCGPHDVLRKPEDCPKPDLEICKTFPASCREFLPNHSLSREDIDFLNDHNFFSDEVSDEIILLCAQECEREYTTNQEAAIQRSYVLISEWGKAVSRSVHNGASQTVLIHAARCRIIPSIEINMKNEVAQRMNNTIRPLAFSGKVVLSPLDDVCFGSAQDVLWTTHKVFAQHEVNNENADDELENHFADTIDSYGKHLHKWLGESFFTSVEQVPLSKLRQFLERVSKLLASKSLATNTVLAANLVQCYQRLNEIARADNRVCQTVELDFIRALGSIIPVVTKDANGEEKLSLAPPDMVFLQGGCIDVQIQGVHIPKSPFSEILNCKSILEKLGVRRSPAVLDWVVVTETIANKQFHMPTSRQVYSRRLPLIVDEIIKLLQNVDDGAECESLDRLHLLNGQGEFKPISELWVIDHLDWRQRVLSLVGNQFEFEARLASSKVGDRAATAQEIKKLKTVGARCSKSRLLSERLCERLAPGIVDADSQISESWSKSAENVIVSDLFIGAAYSLICHGCSEQPDYEGFQDFMKSLKFVWFDIVKSALFDKSGDMIVGSEKAVPGVFDNGKLYVSAVVSQKGAKSAGNVCRILKEHLLSANPLWDMTRHELALQDVFICAHNQSLQLHELQEVLAIYNIPWAGSEDSDNDKSEFAPGNLVGEMYLDQLQCDRFMVLLPDEIVAYKEPKSKMYFFAEVRKQNSMQNENSFLLDVGHKLGGEIQVEWFHIFKLNSFSSEAGNCCDSDSGQADDEDAQDYVPATKEETSALHEELVELNENHSAEEFQAILVRYYKNHNPDSGGKKELFDVVQQFDKSNGDAVQEEFDQEKARQREAQQKQTDQGSDTPRASPVYRHQSIELPPRIDEDEGRAWFDTAVRNMRAVERDLAEAQRSPGEGIESCAVFWANQAAQALVKAVMLCTCGVSADEEKSSRFDEWLDYHYGLDNHLEVDDDDIRWLSKAYLAARVPNSTIYKSESSLPAERYDLDDVHKALEITNKLLKWSKTKVSEFDEPNCIMKEVHEVATPSRAQRQPPTLSSPSSAISSSAKKRKATTMHYE